MSIKNANPVADKPVRQSNFELLRIVAMLMIVATHFAGYSGLGVSGPITLNAVWLRFLSSGAQIGVNSFFLISGYFLIKEDGFRISKLLRFWLTLFSYYLLFYTATTAYRMFILHNFVFSLQTLLNCLFPVITGRLWFASVYFVIYLFSPFINKLLNALDRKAYIKMLVVMFVLWSVIPTLTKTNFQYTHLSWGVFMYCFAGYLRLYKSEIKHKPGKMFAVTTVCFFAIFALKLSISIFLGDVSFIKIYSDGLFLGNNVLIFILSVMIFLLFKNISIKSKLINIIGSATFGVYIVHENEFARQFLANHIYNRAPLNSPWLIPYSVFAIVAIFAVCAVVELLRKNIFEKHYIKLLFSLEQRADSAIDNTVNKILDK